MLVAPFPVEPKSEPAGAPGAALVDWLVQDALPLWSTVGVDRVAGGFFEAIDRSGRPVEAPRRTRVVARQVYVFATAARRGWAACGDGLVAHGLAFLLGRLRLPDGTFAASVRADGSVVDGRFDLYEQAFVLFALAAACAGRADREDALREEADALLQRLRRHWSHPVGGFEEARPRSLPLRSNPHMHLLEAALAWADLSGGQPTSPWDALADELVLLCTTRFIDPRTGAVLEHFDGDWRPMSDAGDAVEPGHQFEWAWLLMRWAQRRGRPDILAIADRLLDVGESRGVDPSRGVAVDALDDRLLVRRATAKVWPQTERVKAWHEACARTSDPHRSVAASAARDASLRTLSRFVSAAHAGLWHEQMGQGGEFVVQDCKASSLYHIVCAIDTCAPAGPWT